MVKGEDQLTKIQYVHATTKITTTATFTSTAATPTTTSIVTTYKAKRIKMKISGSI